MNHEPGLLRAILEYQKRDRRYGAINSEPVTAGKH